jgi:hypothetical protein
MQTSERIYDEWEMLYLFAWYRKENKIQQSPDQLLEKIKASGHINLWKDFLMSAETSQQLTDFVDKHL